MSANCLLALKTLLAYIVATVNEILPKTAYDVATLAVVPLCLAFRAQLRSRQVDSYQLTLVSITFQFVLSFLTVILIKLISSAIRQTIFDISA